MFRRLKEGKRPKREKKTFLLLKINVYHKTKSRKESVKNQVQVAF